jgi:YjbR
VRRPSLTCVGQPAATDLSPALVERVGTICLGLPEAHEHDAWIGVSWRIRQRTFAHLARVEAPDGLVFGRDVPVDPPVDVITFRSTGDELDALLHGGFPFYKPRWHPQVVGMVLTPALDWVELRELLTESYCLLAPLRLARQVQRPSG